MTMNDRMAVMADTIKENVSSLDVAAAMGWEVRHSRCRCPVHGGKDFNCRLYPGNRGYKCFSCGSAGDVIGLVRSVTGMSFSDVLRWFNATFNLGMDIESSGDETRLKRAKNSLKRKADKRAFLDRIERMNFEMYLTVSDVLTRLEETRDANRPQRYSDDWNQPFRDAVELIPEVKAELEYYAMESTVNRQ